MDESASFGPEAHRINELVVRLPVVRLRLEDECFSVVRVGRRHCSL